MTTPNMGLKDMPQNSMQISPPFNFNMLLLDALVQLVPEDKDLTAPPATTEADLGKSWIIGAAPTGDWADKAGLIAICTAPDLWEYVQPRAGWKAYVKDEAAEYRYLDGNWTLAP